MQRQSKDDASSTPETMDTAGTSRKKGRCYLCKSDNKEQNACMKCGKYICNEVIHALWDLWIEILPKIVNPSAYVTVNEQLVAFRGNFPFRQYMPKKPVKYGIKLCVLCDNETGYVWNIQPHLGKPTNQPRETNQGLRFIVWSERT
ncbi:piggyBac transposable element-derived protein 4-like [Uloborus diversus]|uniref:piggyBac transposable element-derived protein 4-like n=1 Tax=Uloborus diversus TaxID=327109 RepID=UPI002409DC8C|nr:piggyBac transposable element-derived protein 4-like [Uloborus diversus]